ncbi:winged helix-turn-helix domain-containing protein [Nitrosopumilus sp.]|uniref:winged helix-turn-helix domain-containing protein n=1 Tax=Nitrosopumilus sp. TaxID=2024843 RepID=UPI00292E055B|nr:winged helix-turn-helix domain-containing protein [Nitrosopumilus sp.]
MMFSLASVFRSGAYEILLILREQSRPILYTNLMNKTSLDRGLFAHYLKMLKQNGLIKENYNKINQERYGYTLTAKAVELLDRIEKTILAYKHISKSKEQLETYNT